MYDVKIPDLVGRSKKTHTHPCVTNFIKSNLKKVASLESSSCGKSGDEWQKISGVKGLK